MFALFISHRTLAAAIAQGAVSICQGAPDIRGSNAWPLSQLHVHSLHVAPVAVDGQTATSILHGSNECRIEQGWCN